MLQADPEAAEIAALRDLGIGSRGPWSPTKSPTKSEPTAPTEGSSSSAAPSPTPLLAAGTPPKPAEIAVSGATAAAT